MSAQSRVEDVRALDESLCQKTRASRRLSRELNRDEAAAAAELVRAHYKNLVEQGLFESQ